MDKNCLLRMKDRITGGNRRLAKLAVQCSADTFVVNQSLVLRINICGKNATFAKRQTVMPNAMTTTKTLVITNRQI